MDRLLKLSRQDILLDIIKKFKFKIWKCNTLIQGMLFRNKGLQRNVGVVKFDLSFAYTALPVTRNRYLRFQLILELKHYKLQAFFASFLNGKKEGIALEEEYHCVDSNCKNLFQENDRESSRMKSFV